MPGPSVDPVALPAVCSHHISEHEYTGAKVLDRRSPHVARSCRVDGTGNSYMSRLEKVESRNTGRKAKAGVESEQYRMDIAPDHFSGNPRSAPEIAYQRTAV